MTQLNFNALEQRAGIVFATGYNPQALTPLAKQMAMDSELVTTPNAGVLSLFTTYVDPKLIETLVTPMRMAEIFGETKKGDWTTQTAHFPVIESTGETSSYGDYSNNGQAGVNVNWPERQPYHYQTIIRLGEREMAMAGAAKIDWSSRKQMAGVLTLNKFQNKSYIYGIDGLKNYGILNDPSALPSITSTPWAAMDGEGVYESIRKLYTELIKQTRGHVDKNTPMVLLLSPDQETNLTKTNQYNVNVTDQLSKNFPNLEIRSIPEFSTDAGEVVKLIVREYEGQETLDLSFTEKMRVHAMIPELSSWKQKRSQGTFGCIIYRPMFIASMLVS
ncbi:major capsid family protein [Providencia alcalifaciens]